MELQARYSRSAADRLTEGECEMGAPAACPETVVTSKALYVYSVSPQEDSTMGELPPMEKSSPAAAGAEPQQAAVPIRL